MLFQQTIQIILFFALYNLFYIIFYFCEQMMLTKYYITLFAGTIVILLTVLENEIIPNRDSFDSAISLVTTMLINSLTLRN